jgi:hypothetical protein
MRGRSEASPRSNPFNRGMNQRRRPSPDEGYQLAVRIFSVVIIGFGVLMLIVTLARGGGPLAVGVLFGLLFIALGSGRLYLSMRG